MNISSIIVTCRPEHMAEVEASLRESGLCDIHFRDDKGHIIVTVEEDAAGDEPAKLKAIADLPHVADAVFSYTCCEEGPEDGTT